MPKLNPQRKHQACRIGFMPFTEEYISGLPSQFQTKNEDKLEIQPWPKTWVMGLSFTIRYFIYYM